MKTRAEQFLSRVEFVLRTRDFTAAEVERRGHLPKNALATILWRCKSQPERFDHIEIRTLENVARGLEVNVVWLVYGYGLQSERHSDTTATLTSALSEGGWDEFSPETIEYAAELPLGYQPTPSVWKQILTRTEEFLLSVSEMSTEAA